MPTYEQLGRFDEAAETMRRALAAGFEGQLDDHPNAHRGSDRRRA